MALFVSAAQAITPFFSTDRPEKGTLASYCKVPELVHVLRRQPPSLQDAQLVVAADLCCHKEIADEVVTDSQGKQKSESDRSARGKVECEPVFSWVRNQYSASENQEIKRELEKATTLSAQKPNSL